MPIGDAPDRSFDSPVDVLVVGAGPAGTAAATVLARAGRSVIVADKAEFPRDKCCGDGLTTLALRMLEKIDFDPGVIASWQTVDSAWL
ncbi:MAG: NAD(P)/FAD-dependent oxidoreductase, partial [Actinomycetota bacterium]